MFCPVLSNWKAFSLISCVFWKISSAQARQRTHGCFRAVLVSKFLSDNLRIMSASKDKTVRVWDIAAEAEVANYSEFKVGDTFFFTAKYEIQVRRDRDGLFSPC